LRRVSAFGFGSMSLATVPLPTPLAISLLLFFSLFAGFPPTAPCEAVPLTVTAASSLKFTVTQGGEALHSSGFTVQNSGKEAIPWTVSSDQAWLKFEPASGSLASHATASVSLVIDPRGFSPGIYVAGVKMGARGLLPRTFEVTMTEQSAFAGDPITNVQRTFPPDSGMINVKSQYGAKGDGVTDDTATIQRAISATVHHPGMGPRIVYFPAGTYLVSRPLLETDLASRWSSLLTLQGENRATTAIQLTDNNPAFQNAQVPSAVLYFASQNGRANGAGNSAFDNNIFDLTIDVGRSNPGAVAVDYLGNNACALRNVTLQSSDPNHAGAVGLSMLRYAVGPCFLKNVLINGFDYGVRVSNNEYSVTFEGLTLLNQRLFGIYNANNVLSIRHLFSTNRVPAIQNQNPAGLITLIGAILRGGSSEYSAIQNQGTLYARDVSSAGYASALHSNGSVHPGSSITEYDSGPVVTQFGGQSSSLNLAMEETPCFEDPKLVNWKSVISYGADPGGMSDSSSAIQAAIDSGATTVYFPTGVYLIRRTILVRGKVRVLEGFDSSLNPSGPLFQDVSNPAPLFKIEAGEVEISFNHMRMGAYYANPAPAVVTIQQDSARPLVLRDLTVGGPPSTIAYQNTSRGTGTLFVENVAARPWQILFPQKVFARQINPEGNMTKIINKGGVLWILGLKTEGAGTNIDTLQGGATEVLGGLIYPVWNISDDRANMIVSDSRASFIFAVSSYKPAFAGRNFKYQVAETQRGVSKSLPTAALPARGFGAMVALYSSGNAPAEPAKELPPASSH